MTDKELSIANEFTRPIGLIYIINISCYRRIVLCTADEQVETIVHTLVLMIHSVNYKPLFLSLSTLRADVI